MIDLDGAAGPWAAARGAVRLALGQVGRLLEMLRAEGCEAVVMAGGLRRPELSRIRMDWQGVRMLPRVARLFRQGDDALLRGIAGLFEEQGFAVLAPDALLDRGLAEAGVLGAVAPDASAQADMAEASAILAALSPYDVGQAVVVAGGVCLAVEAAEGTAQMVARVAGLRQGWAAREGVLVKRPKTAQDRRVDLPAIGPETVAACAAAGLAGIGVEAGGTFVLRREATVAAADAAGLFVFGL